MKTFAKIILTASAIGLVGCGGGGSSDPDSASGSVIAYSGKTTKASLTEENTKYFVEYVNESFSNAVTNTVSSKITSLPKISRKLTGTSMVNLKIIDSDSRAGRVSGKVSVVVEETGEYTGTITYTYDNFSDVAGIVANGKIVNYLTVNSDEIVTKSVVDYQNFHMKIQEADFSIDGSVTSALNQSGSSIVENYVVKNNKTAEMVKYDKFTTNLNDKKQIVSYSGKIYDSRYGYVEVSTLSDLAYNEDGTRKAEGEIRLEGEKSSSTVKFAYDDRVRVEIDKDKDGNTDEVHVYKNGNFEQELPNAAPVISISFPQSIFTDTDMSAVKVSFYDPDLDQVETNYKWYVNGSDKGTTLALDNRLFKKHDKLKLTVTATDDRAGDVKTTTKSKVQEVLNSAPIALIESNATSEDIEPLSNIRLDASKSIDKDDDNLSYEWKIYKYIPEDEWQGEPIVETISPANMDANGDLDQLYIIVEANTSKYMNDPTVKQPIFSANNAGQHIIKCTVFDDDMAYDSMEINLTVMPLDIIEKSESKTFFTGQETLPESTFNQSIVAYDLNNDHNKELIYLTRDPNDLYKTQLHITYDAKDNNATTQSYDINNSNDSLGINVKDINGDGLLDIILGQYILQQNQQFRFEVFNQYIWDKMTIVDDFNGDKKADGAYLNGCLLEIYTNFDNYDEKIQYSVKDCNKTDVTGQKYEHKLKVADFNNDGVEDYLIFSRNLYDYSTELIVVYKDSTGSLTQSKTTQLGENVYGDTIVNGDINGDGFDDLVIASILYENNKNFTFKKIQLLNTRMNGSTNDNFVIADMNNDKKGDILYKNGDILRVLIQGENYNMYDFKLKNVNGIDNLIISDIDNDGKAEIVENFQNRILITSVK